MELFLNFAGVAVGLSLICLWLRTAPYATGRYSYGTQFVALALLILVLFPVISVTDDLYAVQNPAETDSVHRRNLEVSLVHIAANCAELPLDGVLQVPDPHVVWCSKTRSEPVSLPDSIALPSIDNRPPPTV